MAFRFMNWKRPGIRGRTTQQWVSMAESMVRGEEPPSRSVRDDALKLYRNLGTILQLSDPRAVRANDNLVKAEFHPATDWRWRPGVFCGPAVPAWLVEPESGQKLGVETSLWHDCDNKSLVIKQILNFNAVTQASYGLRIETLSFAGEYFSLSFEVPETVFESLGKSHVIRLDMHLETETPIGVYGRLNLAQGPNTEQVLRNLDERDPTAYRVIEFDLAYADLAERPVEKVWLDLIFSSPYMNAINLSDLVLSRYPRSEV